MPPGGAEDTGETVDWDNWNRWGIYWPMKLLKVGLLQWSSLCIVIFVMARFGKESHLAIWIRRNFSNFKILDWLGTQYLSLRIFPLNLGKMKDVERVGIETRDLVGNKDSACRYQKRTPSALDVEKTKTITCRLPISSNKHTKHLKTHQ